MINNSFDSLIRSNILACKGVFTYHLLKMDIRPERNVHWNCVLRGVEDILVVQLTDGYEPKINGMKEDNRFLRK